MQNVPQNTNKFKRNNLFYCFEALFFKHSLVYEFLCGPKHMATPVIQSTKGQRRFYHGNIVTLCRVGLKHKVKTRVSTEFL